MLPRFVSIARPYLRRFALGLLLLLLTNGLSLWIPWLLRDAIRGLEQGVPLGEIGRSGRRDGRGRDRAGDRANRLALGGARSEPPYRLRRSRDLLRAAARAAPELLRHAPNGRRHVPGRQRRAARPGVLRTGRAEPAEHLDRLRRRAGALAPHRRGADRDLASDLPAPPVRREPAEPDRLRPVARRPGTARPDLQPGAGEPERHPAGQDPRSGKARDRGVSGAGIGVSPAEPLDGVGSRRHGVADRRDHRARRARGPPSSAAVS